ncbi:hypothetical protein Vadar_015648 [Vaccinium darrowii]|uniref:Uncharacterized protein n=1 Tax=Vaccinium darrowii TaxID=229202 RepID=A0ACB7ZCF7_9ERIC|nr:hypothetical protein Vadar_015648 [Vaccinium darrowii]
MLSRNSYYYQAENEADKGITSTLKLVYKPRVCRCGMGAEIKIVESEKASKVELYFRCPKPHRERCGFFNWCLPEGWSNIGNSGVCSATIPHNISPSNVSDDAGPLQREVMNLRRQLEYSKMLTKGLLVCLILAKLVITGDMSSSQTAASKGKNPSSVGMKAQWDQLSKECLIHACLEELGGAAYKTGTVLTKVGWVNVVKKFNEQTGETGLGRDPDKGAIAASDDWWDLKLMRHPDCAKFREKPLPLEDEMRILFGSNTATGEHKYTPSSGFLPAAPGVKMTPNIDPENIDA